MINTTIAMRAGRNIAIGALLCTFGAIAVGTIASSSPAELRAAALAAATTQSGSAYALTPGLIDQLSTGAPATGVKFRTVAAVTDAPGQSDTQRCVVEYVREHARTEHGATHANAKAACATPDAPATYERSAARDMTAPGGAKFGVVADDGDVVLSYNVQVTPGWTPTVTAFTDATTGAITGYGVRVDANPGTPDGTTGSASLTIIVSDVNTAPAA